jgi:SAM-dependent methyltransferase
VTALYDAIGGGYAAARRTDPRLVRAIRDALGDAKRVVNVGAGSGSYEPPDLAVVAVEPSAEMIRQRPPRAAPCVQASAEDLPFADGAFDAALAVLTVHHWSDRARGLAEMRRVAKKRVVVFTWDPDFIDAFWLVTDYLPEVGALDLPRFPKIDRLLPGARVTAVPIPHDCTDGFLGAYWRRPEAYLDERVRRGISVLQQLPHDVVDAAIARLAADLASGAWERRNGRLRALPELDLGYRLVTLDIEPAVGRDSRA